MHIGSGAVATIHATQSTMTDARRPCVASKVLAVLSLLSLVSAATNPVLQTEVERDILIALYQNTAGESWTNNNNWNSPEIHVCDWEGISCISPETSSRRLADQVEDTRSVQRIDLSENNLQGSAPLSLLLLLPNIQSLLLNGNNVDYSKMAQQEKETLGTVLDISNVTVTSSVQHLDLSLTTVDSLSRVFTAGNGLTQIHTPYLTDFYASQAQIRGPLPAFLMETHTLERLELGHNEITGTLPMTVGNLRNLKYLNIADNSLQGTLPNTVNQLGRLRYLLAEKNGFTGTIPIGLTSDEYTPLLEQIDLSDQRSESTKPGPTAGLSGPVPAFATQKRLRRVDLGVNSFTGPVPASLLSAVYFADFDFIILGNNLLTGAIPSSVLQRIPAGGLFLENNKFTAVSGCPISVYGCSAILCPPLSYEPRSGRQEEDNRPCLECLQNTKYWGQTQCKLEENTPTAAPVPATPKPTGAPVNTPTTKPPTEAPVPTRTPTISPSNPPDPVYVDERAILLELYTALGGKSWTKAEGWSTPTAADTFCAWHGVVCVSESDRSVKFLHLDSNNLNGSIPSSLYSLPSLESLDLSHNVGLVVTFQGIGNARSLQALDLSSTTIDSIEALVNVAPSLQELYMSDVGGFDGKPIPDDIFKLSNLRQLVFDYNNAVGALSEELGQLSRLVVFSAANNELSGPLPQSLSKLTDLTSLRLTTNHFSGTLPSGFDMLTSLAIIDLSNQWSNGQDDDFDDNGRSGLTGTLPSFANFTQLRRLDLGVNSLSGSIPMAFLAGVDTGDGGLFEFADVGSNFLTGTVPSSLGRLRNVYMQDNKISGIDPLVCNSLPATLIAFGCNAVLCSPASYSQLGRQVAADQPCSPCGLVSGALYYGSTECTSTVQYPSQAPVKGPTSIPAGNVMARTALELIYDECGGKQWSFPANWKEDGLDVCLWDGITCSTQREVISISLRAANLVGTFPSLVVFRNLPALRALVLDGNSVAFSFDGIDAALNLDTLDLTSTELDSVDGIEGAPSLKSVYLASNNLRGEFPTSLLQLTNLERLALAFNTLSKNIPGTINLLTNLEFLSLHDNKFTGTIPTIFGQMNNLFFLLLQSNSLTGPIPTQLNLLTKMRFMDLSSQTINGGDGLSGKLPSFSALGDLKRMTLNGNSLAGSIPSDFLDKATPLNFEHLDLSDNKLTGTVPSTLSKFPAEQYDVTNNRFSAIDSALCDKKLGGIIEAYGCDSILCPRGEYNSKGRQILDADKCESCPGNQFFGMTTCGDPPTQAPVAAPEISAFEVLSKLYDATTGNFWRRKDHWKQSSISVCEWYGVTCSVDGVEQVEDIVLSSNNLDGTVPQEIFQLPYLKSLVLDSNFISMQDLGRIYDAPQLQILDLSNTEIKDVVGIGKARALQELHIKSNDLQGVLPVEIFDIFTLEQLDFDFCAFSGTLGSGIGRLTNLKFLGGDKNQLSGTLPKEMDTLTNLVTMKLGRNSFTGSIPSSLNLLVSITLLDLSDQTEHGGPGLSGKLPALDGMERLTQLILKSNAITGAIPANFLQGVNPDVFEYADLSSNAITGSIPSSLAMLSHVHLHDNLITGVASEMCAESRGVIYKAFGCNAVLCPPKTYSPHGRQESEAVSCMVCEQATLWGTTSCPPKYNNGGNTVRPKISERDVLLKFFESCDGDSWNENQNWMSTASICTWTGIQCTDGSKDGGIEAIELGGNNIVGSPPTELFTLPSLTSLALYSNPLKLVDFSGIEFATNLKELLLDATGISSVAGLERAPSLEILNLRFNQLKSGLPSEIAALTTLHTLTMAYNEMTGRLPPFLEALTNLKSLLLSSNSLSGSLRGVNFPASLRRLDLSQNSFTGPIPDSFLSLVHFQAQLEIDLSGNAFTGSLPTDLTRFNSLSFYASDTKIMKIDSQLCFMKNWNNGDVGKYGCDAILCPAGHSGPNGRHSSAGACRKCPNAGSEFMGSTTCELTSSVNGHVLPRFAVGASFALGCIFRLIL